MATLKEIETAAKRYADAREMLADRVCVLESAIDKAKREHMPTIRKFVAISANAKAALQALVETSAHLFEKPKTQILSGVKVGWVKAKGSIDWDDDAQVVKLIKKHLPDQADTLIKTTETPVKAALANLPAAELKKLGVTVVETGDRAIVKPVDSEIDKLVDALLKEAEAKEDGR